MVFREAVVDTHVQARLRAMEIVADMSNAIAALVLQIRNHTGGYQRSAAVREHGADLVGD